MTAVKDDITVMSKEVASQWIEKHASKRFCMVIYFPTYEQAVKAKKIARFSVGRTPPKNSKIPKVAGATVLNGLDSMMILSDDENGMECLRSYMQRLGYEVGWGW